MKAVTQEQLHRILVIDDNPAIHNDICKILDAGRKDRSGIEQAEALLFGESGSKIDPIRFEIDSAYQGREGLKLVRQSLAECRPYAMAFVDVRMPPGWDGIETITRIWKTYPDLQIVICTAYSDYAWEDISKELGCSDSVVILKKPFDNIEVLQLAHTLSQKWLLSQKVKERLEELDGEVHKRTRELRKAVDRLKGEVEERKNAESALSEAEHLAATSRMAAWIIHEIKNPLTGIKNAFLLVRPHSKSLSSGRFQVFRHRRTSLWLAGVGFQAADAADEQVLSGHRRGLLHNTHICRCLEAYSSRGAFFSELQSGQIQAACSSSSPRRFFISMMRQKL